MFLEFVKVFVFVNQQMFTITAVESLFRPPIKQPNNENATSSKIAYFQVFPPTQKSPSGSCFRDKATGYFNYSVWNKFRV